MTEILKNKKVLIAAGAALLVIVLVLFAVLAIGSDGGLDKQLSLGDKYLSALDYDKAILTFTKALSIDTMSMRAYIGLADAYIGKGDKAKAIETLQQGYEKTNHSSIKNKLDGITGSAGADPKASGASQMEQQPEESSSSSVELSFPVDPTFVVQPEYDSIRNYNDGFTMARKGYVWYILDVKGQVVKELNYDDAFAANYMSPAGEPFLGSNIQVSMFSDGLAKVYAMDRYTLFYIDTNGNKVLTLEHTAQEAAAMAAATTGSSTTQRNSGGGRASAGTMTGFFSDGITWSAPATVLAWDESTVSYIDKTGQTVFMSPQGGVDRLDSFSEGLARQVINNADDTKTLRYIDIKGNVAFTLDNCTSGGNFSNGYAWVINRDGKKGIVDKTGKFVLEPIYGDLGDVGSDNIMFFGEVGSELLGIIDITGRVVVEPRFKSTGILNEGVSNVTEDGITYGVINTKGEYVIEPKDGMIWSSSDGLMVVKDVNGRCGVINNPLYVG